jgi:hypothetical protein
MLKEVHPTQTYVSGTEGEKSNDEKRLAEGSRAADRTSALDGRPRMACRSVVA